VHPVNASASRRRVNERCRPSFEIIISKHHPLRIDGILVTGCSEEFKGGFSALIEGRR
jgi:hypothetical protein